MILGWLFEAAVYRVSLPPYLVHIGFSAGLFSYLTFYEVGKFDHMLRAIHWDYGSS